MSENVGIVIVSHSADVARGTALMVEQMGEVEFEFALELAALVARHADRFGNRALLGKAALLRAQSHPRPDQIDHIFAGGKCAGGVVRIGNEHHPRIWSDGFQHRRQIVAIIHGGNGNHAAGGSADIFSSIFDLIGSDVIATGHNGAGNGGNGYFAGSMVDIDVAIYAPINIAIAGYDSTADAHQTNNVHFDQSTVQMAGIGGDGGHGNAAFGGDIAMHLLSDLHLLDHA